MGNRHASFPSETSKTVGSCECRSTVEDGRASLIDHGKDINREIVGLKSTVENELDKVKPRELCESHELVKR